MSFIKEKAGGILLVAVLAAVSVFISGLIPYHLVGAGVFALLFGMMLNPVVSKHGMLEKGLSFTSKKILRPAIILMGVTLSFSQVLEVGKFSLIVMMFTLFTAYSFRRWIFIWKAF